MSTPFHELVSYNIGGGWGTDVVKPGSSSIGYVIRGTDIPRVAVGDVSTVPRRFHKASNLASRVLRPGDIVFEVSGGSKGQPVGRALQITEQLLSSFDNDVMCASFCKLIRVDPAIADPGFVFRVLQAAYADGELDAYQVQSTGITNFKWKPFLKHFDVDLPDRDVQERVAAALDVFDDLIENNRRRVGVLEEMARAIYREWFVKFRYPGYEDVPLVGSALGPIPEEWTVRRLDELATFVGGSTRTKAAYVDAGYVAFSAAGPDGFVPDYEVDGPGVVLSAVGAKCGRTFWASGKWSSIANTIKILPKEPELFANWLRFATDDSSVWPKRGSAQPFVSINDARGVLSRVATRETHLRFEDAVKPMVDQAVVLEAGSRGLAALRDLLLPKLVTGQIDVTSLDLDAAIAEQVA